MPTPPPTDLLLGVRTSTADLITELDGARWTDTDVAVDTLLPEWTRGHLLTHLARNADGVAGTLAGALRNEVVAQYPGGREQRAADIAAGADRPMSELLADVRDSAGRLDRVLGALDEAEAWDRDASDKLTAAGWLPRRWLEVEVHRVDLGHGYGPDRWPPLFVATMLRTFVATLPERVTGPLIVTTDPSTSVSGEAVSWGTTGTEVRGADWAVLAWMLGRPRGDALTATPTLRPWGWARRD